MGALKLTMTELMETNMPSMIRSAKPYLPPELQGERNINNTWCMKHPTEREYHRKQFLFWLLREDMVTWQDRFYTGWYEGHVPKVYDKRGLVKLGPSH